jgi:hypothetical protein
MQYTPVRSRGGESQFVTVELGQRLLALISRLTIARVAPEESDIEKTKCSP